MPVLNPLTPDQSTLAHRCPECHGEMLTVALPHHYSANNDVLRCVSGPKCHWEGLRSDAIYAAARSPGPPEAESILGPESQAFSDLCRRGFEAIEKGCAPAVMRFLTLPGMPADPIDSSFIWMLDF